jgi:Family of unknown function (DUF6160)
MKRVLTFLAILLLPLSVWAMTPITDTQLSDVTGQAGVSINFDFTLDLQFGQLGWGDSDGYAGFGTIGSGGWVGIDSLDMSTLHIWPRTDFSMDNTTGFGINGDEGDWDQLKYLTIDVATVPASLLGSVFGTNVTGITAVVIGIPTLSLTMASMDGNVVLGARSTTSTIGGQIEGVYTADAKAVQGPVFNQLLGTFYVGGMNMATGGGSIYIFAHGTGSMVGAVSGSTLYGSGVTMALNNVTVSYILFDTLSWGDIDGLYATGFATAGAPFGNATWGLMGPGWVGLKNVGIKNLIFNGVMAIDVFTVLSAGANTLDTITSVDETNLTYQDLVGAFNDIYLRVPPGSVANPTAVSIGFKDGFTVSMGAFGGQVKLGGGVFGYNLVGNQVMGDIYVGGMTMTIRDNPVAGNGSFVHILAH